jgi:rhodanese-related sulfurtransferase
MQFAVRRLPVAAASCRTHACASVPPAVLAATRVSWPLGSRGLKHKPPETPRTGPSGREKEGAPEEVFMELYTPSTDQIAEEAGAPTVSAREFHRLLSDDAERRNMIIMDVRTPESILGFDSAFEESLAMPLPTLKLTSDADDRSTAEGEEEDDEDALAAIGAARWLGDLEEASDKAFFAKYRFQKDDLFDKNKQVVVVSNIGTRSQWVVAGAVSRGYTNFVSLLGGVRVYHKMFD